MRTCEKCKHWSDPQVIEGSRNVLGICGVKNRAAPNEGGLEHRTYSYLECMNYFPESPPYVESAAERIAQHSESIRKQNEAIDQKWGDRRTGGPRDRDLYPPNYPKGRGP